MNTVSKPKKWKMAILTWLCIYPLINILFFLLMPYLTDLHQLVKTLIITIILVPIMGILLALLQKKYWSWLIK